MDEVWMTNVATFVIDACPDHNSLNAFFIALSAVLHPVSRHAKPAQSRSPIQA